jgi:hypothetical protein
LVLVDDVAAGVEVVAGGVVAAPGEAVDVVFGAL